MPVRATTSLRTGTTRRASELQPASAIKRHADVAATVRDLGKRARDGEASSTMFLPSAGTRYEAFAFDYHTGMAKQLNLQAEPKDGMVKGTIVINVSGHGGEADKFAKSNVYNVKVTLPNGKVLAWSNVPRNDPSKTEYATAIDIEFPYLKGKTIVEAWPTGSAGVGGYLEGRLYEVHSKEQPFKASSTSHTAYDDS